MDQSYEEWARDFHGQAFLRRSAVRHAPFVLPHLRPGQRLVDIGCGPGSITRGLADTVAPGEVVGVDRDAAYLAMAEAAPRPDNLRFELADAAELPFDDGSFDVAFSHFVLQHVESPPAVLAEAHRVLAPGGLVAVADADLDGYLLHPTSPALEAAAALEHRTRRNPDVGRRLVQLLLDAGFGDVELTVVPNVVTGPAAAAAAASAAWRLRAPTFVAHAVEQGWATAEELTAMADAWVHWGDEPGAVFVTLACQALARR